MPTATASPRRTTPIVVVATDEDDLLVSIGEPGELRAEASGQHRDADRAGDVGVVELLIGPRVDDQGSVRALLLDLARRQRQDLGSLGQQRALVELDDRLEVRRLWSELGDRLFDELPLVGDRERRVVLALEADRRGDLHVHPGTPAHRAAEVPRPDLAVVGQAQELVLKRVEDSTCPSRSSIARSGRATSLTNSESPVRTAHGSSPRLRSTRAKAVCSGRWPGVCSARISSWPTSSSKPSSIGSCS